jgi:hypothetical protein
MPLTEGGTLNLKFSNESRSLSYVQGGISERVDSTNISCIANRGVGDMETSYRYATRISGVEGKCS